jgi:uncharacterized membrane protein
VTERHHLPAVRRISFRDLREALALGWILFFLGLAVVVPILGHASWHLYRKVVVR